MPRRRRFSPPKSRVLVDAKQMKQPFDGQVFQGLPDIPQVVLSVDLNLTGSVELSSTATE